MDPIPINEQKEYAEACHATQIDRKVFYPVFIAHGRKENPISWGKPCSTGSEALHWLRQEVASGGASMGVVVVFANGRKEAIRNYIAPRSARTAINHYLDILDLLAREKE
jgi:hypothetical protein